MLMWCAVCWDTQELLQLLPSPILAVLRMGQYGLMMSTVQGMRTLLQPVHMSAGETVIVIMMRMLESFAILTTLWMQKVRETRGNSLASVNKKEYSGHVF